MLIWISVVPIAFLGCLLGRDFLDSVGAVLHFANRTLECTFLNSQTQRLETRWQWVTSCCRFAVALAEA